jgi:hypothetical protein
MRESNAVLAEMRLLLDVLNSGTLRRRLATMAGYETRQTGAVLL